MIFINRNIYDFKNVHVFTTSRVPIHWFVLFLRLAVNEKKN